MDRLVLSAALELSCCLLAACAPAHRPGSGHPGARVEDARFVTLGGLDQWITIRGDDAGKPILLLLHGGPGDVQSPLVATYAPYERDFVLVQWDQRGAGRTYGKYGAKTPELTLDRLASDGIELTEYLRARFGRNDIILLGHSWGTAIATEMVRRRPDLFAAYVGTGQIASWAESVSAQFDFLVARARETGDAAMLAQLEAIGRPDPMNQEQYFSFTRPLGRFLGASDAAWLAGLPDLIRAAPGMTDGEMESLRGGMVLSGRVLLPTQMEERLSTEALRFDVPYYVIQGRDDLFTPTRPVEAYFQRIVAPRKQMTVLEGAGHFALVTHAPAFLAALERMLGLEAAAAPALQSLSSLSVAPSASSSTPSPQSASRARWFQKRVRMNWLIPSPPATVPSMKIRDGIAKTGLPSMASERMGDQTWPSKCARLPRNTSSAAVPMRSPGKVAGPNNGSASAQ
ncbi:MAG TPA: alpha/beta hydrolase [Kofleriaceae bacterium]|nr:alpha/beta hydrolase [Kofleriaceae bacterium]